VELAAHLEQVEVELLVHLVHLAAQVLPVPPEPVVVQELVV
jgi:hypothetical protein